MREIQMDIKPYDKTIRQLLGSKRQFIIPRFQRIYSWDKKNYQEFFEDMVNNLSITQDGNITANPYFLGTMLFIGNFSEGTDQKIEVVDGQQRLTTITILFSAISEKFKELKALKLSDQIFSYIMAEDDNGKEYRVLKSKTSHPFFAYFIQDKKKEIQPDACTEEEVNIKKTYLFFKNQLESKKLRGILHKKFDNKSVSLLKDIDILKAIRDQVLCSTFVSISTTARDQANKIFEILNAKGKRLVYIDLIKNKIFEMLSNIEPADFAEDSWKRLIATLTSGNENIGIETYYQHYWLSKYSKVPARRLYDKFSTIPKNRKSYKSFLNDLVKNAQIYMKIITPDRNDYNNRKEYYEVVQILNNINNYFHVVQTRIAILSLFDAKSKRVITLDTLKKTLRDIENFHFAYTAILSNRANRLEKVYSSFAVSLRKAENRSDANEIIEKNLLKPLNELFPSYVDFYNKFTELTYSKKGGPISLKTKYAINKLNSFFEHNNIFKDDGTIEHILPEKDGESSLNIGNLILLEQRLNDKAEDKEYINKIKIYKKSKYTWIQDFVKSHDTWVESDIKKRAGTLARTYFEKIFKRKIK